MHDSNLVFRELNLKEGDSFLDLGCGPGDYALHAAHIIADSGMVYALDKWKYMIDGLKQKAEAQGLKNIKAIVCDITDQLPIEDSCIDVCFLATVLHTLNPPTGTENLFKEIRRVLKLDGRMVMINCKKEDQPFGPPLHLRLSPEEVEETLEEYGFKMINYVDLGYNYMTNIA